jgi:hypothetical protein
MALTNISAKIEAQQICIQMTWNDGSQAETVALCFEPKDALNWNTFFSRVKPSLPQSRHDIQDFDYPELKQYHNDIIRPAVEALNQTLPSAG